MEKGYQALEVRGCEMKDISASITVFIFIVAFIISILFADTKVTYENGTSENMLFIEAISLIIKE